MVGNDKLVLSVGWDGSRINGVTIASTRHTGASRVLEGKMPELVVRMVPMLFSLCGRAQETAAVLALEAATGRVPDVGKERERRVVAEAAMEYLWRILADWPALVGEAPAMETLAQIRTRIKHAEMEGWQGFSRELRLFLEQEVLSMAPEEWLEAGNIEAWAAAGKTIPARVLERLLEDKGAIGQRGAALMAPPEPEALLKEIEPEMREQDDFPAIPSWAGEARETGALARQADAPLVRGLRERGANAVALRFLARLVELAEMPQRFLDESDSPAWLGAVSPRPNWGLSWVECARGLLLHQVRVEEGRVARYRIVAPTEWNFHPQGPLVKGLEGLAAASVEAVQAQTAMMVQALDPCVAYEIEVYHA